MYTYPNRYRLYTGPTLVQHMAERLRQSPDVTVDVEGTEHVYLTTRLHRNDVLQLAGHNYQHRDLQCVQFDTRNPFN